MKKRSKATRVEDEFIGFSPLCDYFHYALGVAAIVLGFGAFGYAIWGMLA